MRLVVVALLASVGCVGIASENSGRDVGARDAAPPDAAERDAAGRDAAGSDAAGRDATSSDDVGVDAAPMCGNGITESGERCDGDCPTSCPARACVSRRLAGDASACTARCVDTPVDVCMNGDGCCPAGCDLSSDNDCDFDCTDFDAWPADWAAEEERALVEMNSNRAAGTGCASGPKTPVGPLTMDRQLRIAARCHSFDMADNDFFSHTGSSGNNFSARARDAGYTGSPRAENIAAGNGTGLASVGQWMGSSTGHCDAIMNGGYNEVGIGYMRKPGTMWTHYWTAVFGSR